MSKLSEKLQKLKERRRTSSPSSSSSPSRGLPSFRFSAADEELTEIIDQDLGDDKLRLDLKDDISEDEEYSNVVSEAKHLRGDESSSREPSPLKESLMNKFSKFSSSKSQNPSINNCDPEFKSGIVEEDPDGCQETPTGRSSWLHQVKGKIAQKVEEKYSEYKNEKEMRKLMNDTGGSFDSNFDDFMLEDDDTIDDFKIEDDKQPIIAHSFSDESIVKETEDMHLGRRSSTPASLEADSHQPQGSAPQTPQEKRRFMTFGKYFDRSNKTEKSTPQTTTTIINEPTSLSTNTTIEASTPKSIPEGSTTPTKSLKSRMMEKFGYGKSPGATSTPIPIDEPSVSCKMVANNLQGVSGSHSPKEDPFLATYTAFVMPKSPKAKALAEIRAKALAQMKSAYYFQLISSYFDPKEDPFLDLNLSFSTKNEPLDLKSEIDSDVESAVEADEAMTFSIDSEHDTITNQVEISEEMKPEPPQPFISWIQNYWWSIGLPLCFILFLQLLPIPQWVIGFITAFLVSVPTTAYITYILIDDNMPRTPFIENIQTKKAERPAIIVQEELRRIYTWMNLWPLKKGPYDPLTYDVRRTISVRIMLHGPWLEMRFPKRNLPLRRMYNDKEPSNVQFHEHVEVIDLSTCSIDLQPDNLPTKRIWSKKYPIRIQASTRKPFSTEEATQKMAAHDDIPDEAESKANDTDEDEMLDAKEHLDEDLDTTNDLNESRDTNKSDTFDKSSIIMTEDDDKKVFYLFTKTAREKEEWFNHFMVAAKFMEDWEHQNPKEGAIYDTNYETFKVKEQKFKMFMEDYPQAKNEEDAKQRHEDIKSNPELLQCAKDQNAFLNIYFGRMWHDLHSNKDFIEYLREKLTRKLLKVKISHYFEDIKVTTLDLGPKLPHILSVSTPWQDEYGLWVDLDIEYHSICQATVQTQGIRLPAKDEPDREAAELLSRQATLCDSDEEDSAEEDDDVMETNEAPDLNGSTGGSAAGTPGGHELPPLPGFKARLVEGILRSDFVAKMAESEWVKKNITSKNITLQLQLHSVKGTLRANFPPAPSDRIWYGFREPPELDLALRPQFGGHGLGKYEGTISTVMKHLEKRLKVEFMKVLVCPNTDDLVLPFLHHVPYSLTEKNSKLTPESIYVPKIKASQSSHNFTKISTSSGNSSATTTTTTATTVPSSVAASMPMAGNSNNVSINNGVSSSSACQN